MWASRNFDANRDTGGEFTTTFYNLEFFARPIDSVVRRPLSEPGRSEDGSGGLIGPCECAIRRA